MPRPATRKIVLRIIGGKTGGVNVNVNGNVNGNGCVNADGNGNGNGNGNGCVNADGIRIPRATLCVTPEEFYAHFWRFVSWALGNPEPLYKFRKVKAVKVLTINIFTGYAGGEGIKTEAEAETETETETDAGSS